MVKYFSIVFFLLGSIVFYGQTSFPKSWEGNYKGELQIYGVDAVKMKLPMELAILQKNDSIFQWKITYLFKGKEDVRDYELLVKDAKKGHYIIDEKNTILIDGFYKSAIFTSFFEVNKSFIIATYSKTEGAIIFEIITANSNTSTSTGNQKYKDEEIPEVASFLVNGRQKAILTKQ